MDRLGWRRLTRITNEEPEKFSLNFSRCAHRRNGFDHFDLKQGMTLSTLISSNYIFLDETFSFQSVFIYFRPHGEQTKSWYFKNVSS